MSSEMDFEISQSRTEAHSYEPQRLKSKKHVQFNTNVLSHHFLTIYRHNQNPISETVTEKLKSETEQQVSYDFETNSPRKSDIVSDEEQKASKCTSRAPHNQISKVISG